MKKINTTKKIGRLALAAGIAMGLGSQVGMAADAVKVGVLLPYTGTFAALGTAITNGLKQAVQENGNKLGGRDVEYVIVDSEANPGKAPQNMSKLVIGEKVDVVIGPVHSGVAMGVIKVAREEGALTIIPNAGLNAATRQLCAPNIFRTSFSAWQTSYPMGQAAYDMGYREIVTMAWNFSFGKESAAAFEQGFEEAGGKVIKTILTPFPKVEFQSYLTDVASIKPDAVFTFYAGGGAVKFVKDYAAAGLKSSIPLLGSGFLTDGTLEAQGDAAEGVITTLHYADGLAVDKDAEFRAGYEKAWGKPADIYAVQGYDAGQLLVQALEKTGGNTDDKKALIAAMESVKIDSPRGEWSFTASHNPAQNIYLRKVVDGKNLVIATVANALEDPGTGCKMAK